MRVPAMRGCPLQTPGVLTITSFRLGGTGAATVLVGVVICGLYPPRDSLGKPYSTSGIGSSACSNVPPPEEMRPGDTPSQRQARRKQNRKKMIRSLTPRREDGNKM